MLLQIGGAGVGAASFVEPPPPPPPPPAGQVCNATDLGHRCNGLDGEVDDKSEGGETAAATSGGRHCHGCARGSAAPARRGERARGCGCGDRCLDSEADAMTGLASVRGVIAAPALPSSKHKVLETLASWAGACTWGFAIAATPGSNESHGRSSVTRLLLSFRLRAVATAATTGGASTLLAGARSALAKWNPRA